MLFDSFQSEFIILDAALTYQTLTNENPPLIHLFNIYFMAKHDYLFSFDGKIKEHQIAAKEELEALTKRDYFERFLPIIISGDL